MEYMRRLLEESLQVIWDLESEYPTKTQEEIYVLTTKIQNVLEVTK
jgi:hypothetical protein